MVMKNVTKKNQKLPYLLLLLLLSCLPTLAQNGVTVKGTVLDSTGETIIGASVVVKGNTSIGTISDIDGNFTLTVPNNNVTPCYFIYRYEITRGESTPSAIDQSRVGR